MVSDGGTLSGRYECLKDPLVREFCGEDSVVGESGEFRVSNGYQRDPLRADGRRIFDKVIHLRKEDKEIEETEDPDRLREILRDHKEQLLKMDPFLGLKHALERGGWDTESEHLRIGSFGLVYPSLKALNDIYLGHTAADRYIARLQDLIEDELGKGAHSEIFYMNHKGGCFLLDLDRFAMFQGLDIQGNPGKVELLLKDKLKLLQRSATDILKSEIEERIKQLVTELYLKETREQQLIAIGEERRNMSEEEELDTISRQLEAIDENIKRLSNLHRSLSGEFESAGDEDGAGASLSLTSNTIEAGEIADTVPGYWAHVSFGLSPLESAEAVDMPSDLMLYSNLMNAQRALNMNALRTFNVAHPDGVVASRKGLYAVETGDVDVVVEDPEGDFDQESMYDRSKSIRSVIQKFNYTYLLADLVRARSEIMFEVVDVDEDVMTVRHEWKEFFYIDDESRLRMRPEMIMQFRRERISKKYTGILSDKIRRRIFAKYYDRVNTIDVLKNFRVDDIDRYLGRVGEILNVVDSIDRAVSREDDIEALRDLAKESSNQLSVLVKDEADEITCTMRGSIARLFDDDDKFMLFADHIGFGGFNQADHERIAIELIDMLGLRDDEIGMVYGIPEDETETKATAWRRLIEVKFAGVKGDAEAYAKFIKLLLSVGDKGTEKIREVEEVLNSTFKKAGAKVALMAGGDEVTAFVSQLPVHLKTPEALAEVLRVVSEECRLRIYGVLQRKGDNPMMERMMIARYIRAFWAANEEHDRMKADADQIPVRVVPIKDVLPAA